MEVMLLAVFISLSNLICLIVGVKVGQKAHRGEDIRMVNLPNPIEKIQSIKDKHEYKREQEAVDTMLYNIDVYDGTGLGQKDIGL